MPKYFNLDPKINYYSGSVGLVFIDAFQSLINEQFDITPNAYTIQEESIMASGSFNNVEVRVLTAIDSETGEKLGDDFKNILFKDLQHATGIGFKYYFDGNYWLTVNSEIIKNFAASATVRRCNNTLRWADQNDIYQIEPCVIDYKLTFPRNRNSDPIVAGGIMVLYVQSNPATMQLHENQRFLFGNSNQWNCYKVLGGGVRNFLNNQTTNNKSSPLIELMLMKNTVNYDTDDVINGIADYNRYAYQLIVSPSPITGMVGDTYQLMPIVTLNNNIISKTVSYSSSGSVATVSGSGLVTLVANGNCMIYAWLNDNQNIISTINVAVSGSVSGQDIRISPVTDYVLEGDTQTYTCYLFTNGVQQINTFNFNIANNNVPANNYAFTVIDGNTFSVKNNSLYLNYPLVINCISGSNSKQFSITLKGAW